MNQHSNVQSRATFSFASSKDLFNDRRGCNAELSFNFRSVLSEMRVASRLVFSKCTKRRNDGSGGDASETE